MSCIELSKTAADEISSIIEAQNLEKGTSLRMSILGGGCSGMRYSLGFETTPSPEKDFQFEANGVKIVIQKKFAPHFTGTEVDFLDTPTARGFSIENPNYPKTSGCAGCGG